MAKSPKENKMPSVLSFEKKLVPSDGYLFGTLWENRHETGQARALPINTKSVRGTISNRLSTKDSDSLNLNAKVESPNLQVVDDCSLNLEEDTLKMHFTLKVLGGLEKPSACNDENVLATYRQALAEYTENYGFEELARRYAINIANGRYLWRNRVGAEQIEVVVNTGEDNPLIFNVHDYSLNHFDDNDQNITALTTKITQALSGQCPFLLLSINIYARIGKAQEVYPSQELIFSKEKSDKSKTLYQVNQAAALHSQKIGNALRTIDTWYPEFDSAQTGPIAIEPYGAVTNLGKAYRTGTNKADFYTLFDRFAQGEPLFSAEEEHYVIAVLIRGGIFSESSKEK